MNIPVMPIRPLTDRELARLMKTDPAQERIDSTDEQMEVAWELGSDVPYGTLLSQVRDDIGRRFAVAVAPNEDVIAGYELPG